MSDAWDFYLCRVDNRPASIFVDLGIRKDVPVADLGDMAWLRVYTVSRGKTAYGAMRSMTA